MKKMNIRKMLERIVVATNKRRAKNIVLVSTDGEIVEAEFARGSGIRCGPDPNTDRLEYPVGSNRHF